MKIGRTEKAILDFIANKNCEATNTYTIQSMFGTKINPQLDRMTKKGLLKKATYDGTKQDFTIHGNAKLSRKESKALKCATELHPKALTI